MNPDRTHVQRTFRVARWFFCPSYWGKQMLGAAVTLLVAVNAHVLDSGHTATVTAADLASTDDHSNAQA